MRRTFNEHDYVISVRSLSDLSTISDDIYRTCVLKEVSLFVRNIEPNSAHILPETVQDLYNDMVSRIAHVAEQRSLDIHDVVRAEVVMRSIFSRVRELLCM